MIDAGTVAEALLEPRLTSTPPTPAGAESCTVPVDGEPPVTDEGDRVSEEIVPVPGPLGSIVRLADVKLADVAEIEAVTCEPTEVVVTVNVPDDAPCAIVIDPGTVAEALFEPRFTSTPPTPAGEASCTVPVDGEPPVTVAGDKVSDEIVPVPTPAGFSCTCVLTGDEPGAVAVTVTDVADGTLEVVTGNVADVAPAGMKTAPGTDTAGLFDVSCTVTPPAGAGEVSVTVPVAP